MTISLESRFQAFLDDLPGSERVSPRRPGIKDGESEADYFLQERRIVVEIKTLKDPQLHKGESVIDDYLDDTKIKIFGTLPLSRIAKSNEHLAVLEKTIARRMTRGIERVCKSADKQIKAELARLPHLATGLLIVINERLTELHPREVADRVVDFTRSKETAIHHCLLIFESHRVNINGRLLPYPLLLDLTRSARQRRARTFIKRMQDSWARRNGFENGLPRPEPSELEYHPRSVTFGR